MGAWRTCGKRCGQCSQTLVRRHNSLPEASRAHARCSQSVLDFLYDDLAAALKRLLRLSEGDYSPDKYAERFPKIARGPTAASRLGSSSRTGLAERKPATSTIESWRYVFQALEEHFADRSAASIMSEEAAHGSRG